jgi:hypothetical protein
MLMSDPTMPKVLRAFFESLPEEDAKRVSIWFDSTPDYSSWKAITDIFVRRFPHCADWELPRAD